MTLDTLDRELAAIDEQMEALRLRRREVESHRVALACPLKAGDKVSWQEKRWNRPAKVWSGEVVSVKYADYDAFRVNVVRFRADGTRGATISLHSSTLGLQKEPA